MPANEDFGGCARLTSGTVAENIGFQAGI